MITLPGSEDLHALAGAAERRQIEAMQRLEDLGFGMLDRRGESGLGIALACKVAWLLEVEEAARIALKITGCTDYLRRVLDGCSQRKG
jgi:hypothetical protein